MTMLTSRDDIRQILARLGTWDSDSGQHRHVLTCWVNEDKDKSVLYAPSTDLRDVIDRWWETPIGIQDNPVALSVEEAVNEIWGRAGAINQHGYSITVH